MENSSGLTWRTSSRQCSHWPATTCSGWTKPCRSSQQQHPRKAELVKLRFFAGLTTAQAAQSLGVSATTAENDWSYARAWLRLEMSGGRPPDTSS